MRKRLRTAVVLAGSTLLLCACGGGSGLLGGLGGKAANPQQSRYESGLEHYKKQIDQRVLATNRSAVSSDAPQPMLRSVVVVAFAVDGAGRLLNASVYRTNGDDEVERTALNSLRRAAPLPPPPPELLDRSGRVELMESWLFNTDGRFQLRSLAAAQRED